MKMDDTQHFCLRWNNYQSSITSAFENLRDDEDFVDVTLACDGRSLKAHRVVLSACSPYFRDLLKSTPCKHPVIVLQDVSYSDLHALVEFIYHGEVNVHQHSLSSFLKTAEILRVSGLTQQQAEETNNQLAHIYGLANSAGPSVIREHPFSEKTSSEVIFPHNISSSLQLKSSQPVQLIRRAAVAAALHRSDCANFSESEESLKLKKERNDNGLPAICKNSDISNRLSQISAPSYSTTLPNNNNSSPIKDVKGEKYEGKIDAANGNVITFAEKLSLTPSPEENLVCDDVKTEPMELLCSGNNPQSEDHSNASSGEHDVNRSSSGVEAKGSSSSANDDEMDNSTPAHHFLMSGKESKFLTPTSSFSFPISALADPSTLASFNSQLQTAAEFATSPQGACRLLDEVTINETNGNIKKDDIIHHSKQLLVLNQQEHHLSEHTQHQHTSYGYNRKHDNSSNLSINSIQLSTNGRLALPMPLAACHRCDVCGKLLSTKLTLKRHKEQQHLQPLNNAVCNLCHKVFRTLNSLNNHKSIYHRRQKNHSYLHTNHGSLLQAKSPSNTTTDYSNQINILSHHHQPASIKQCIDIL